MKKCILTGATGLVGSHLLSPLSQDWSVVALSRQRPSFANLEYLPFDLSQSWTSHQLPPTCDAVIHLAQSEHFREFPQYAENVFRINTFTTLKLLDYARQAGANTFILASSGGIYGYGDQGFSEDHALCHQQDLGFYLSTKLCAEILAENYTDYLNVIILRFFFVYGPNQRPTMLIPRLVQSVLNEKPITLQGRDGIRLNPTHVFDVVRAIIQALELKNSHKINIAGPDILNFRQIGEIIGSTLNKEPKFLIQSEQIPKNLIGDTTKMCKLLSSSKIQFQEGIKTIISDFTDVSN